MNNKWSRKNPVLCKSDAILRLQGFLNWLGWGQELKWLSSNDVCKNIFCCFKFLSWHPGNISQRKEKTSNGSPVQEDRILHWTFERIENIPDVKILRKRARVVLVCNCEIRILGFISTSAPNMQCDHFIFLYPCIFQLNWKCFVAGIELCIAPKSRLKPVSGQLNCTWFR